MHTHTHTHTHTNTHTTVSCKQRGTLKSVQDDGLVTTQPLFRAFVCGTGRSYHLRILQGSMFCYLGAVRCSGCPEKQASPGPPDQSHNSASESDAQHMPAPCCYTCFVMMMSSIASLDASRAAALHRPIARLRSMTLAGCDFASVVCIRDHIGESAYVHDAAFDEADTTRV